MNAPKHESVLLDEVMQTIAPRPGMHIIDATFGSGGHSLALLGHVLPGGKIVGIERDPEIFHHAPKAKGLTVVNDSYENIESIAKQKLGGPVDAVLFDFGIHSYHVDEAARGMSFRRTEPLDMRFAPDPHLSTAKDILNGSTRQELLQALRVYGEEPYASAIAEAIVHVRRKTPLATTDDLVRVVMSVVPKSRQQGKIHPATRTFQAIRMLVNDEMATMERGLRAACAVVSKGGLVLAIGFHRIDHIVSKNIFRECAKTLGGRILTKHAIKPSRKEVLTNRRSRSAQMRVWQKE